MREPNKPRVKGPSTASASKKQNLNRARAAAEAAKRRKLARWNLRAAALRRDINSINAQLKTPIAPAWADKLERDLARLNDELLTLQTKQKLLGN